MLFYDLYYSDVTESEFIKKVEDEVLEEGFIVIINKFSSTPDDPDDLVTIDFYHEDNHLEVDLYCSMELLTVDECVNDITHVLRSLS